MKAALIQLNAGQDEKANVEKALKFIDIAAREGAQLVALPEYFHYMGPEKEKYAHSHTLQSKLIQSLQAKAAEHKIYLLGGTFLETSPVEGLCYNTSPLFGPDGSLLAAYRKIHLYDVEIPGRLRFRESQVILPGKDVVVARTPWGKWGLSICYDLRFPELFRKMALQGAQLIFVPAAFALFTGKDHWEVLLRARAIENQVYILAPNQLGSHLPAYQSYGNSMIVDPWGTVISRAPEEEGLCFGTISWQRVKKVREELPCLEHRVPEVYGQLPREEPH